MPFAKISTNRFMRAFLSDFESIASRVGGVAGIFIFLNTNLLLIYL